MKSAIDPILIILVLANLYLLVTCRIRSSIRVVAAQGIFLGLIPIFAHSEGELFRACLISFVSIALKGLLFPLVLNRILVSTNLRREIEPIVGYTASVLIGVTLFIISLWLASKVPAVGHMYSVLALAVALSTMLIGLFFIVTRRKAINQILGYIILENGIFAFGFALDIEAGMIVELGILIDALLAVSVMGLAVYHIHREYDGTDTDLLSALKD